MTSRRGMDFSWELGEQLVQLRKTRFPGRIKSRAWNRMLMLGYLMKKLAASHQLHFFRPRAIRSQAFQMPYAHMRHLLAFYAPISSMGSKKLSFICSLENRRYCKQVTCILASRYSDDRVSLKISFMCSLTNLTTYSE